MSTLTAALRDIEGANPRVIAALHSLEFDIEYIREDLEGRYSGADLEEAYQLMMANQVTIDDFKDIVAAETIDAQTYFLDEMVVFLFPSSRYNGVFASFDRTPSLPVTEIVEVARNNRL